MLEALTFTEFLGLGSRGRRTGLYRVVLYSVVVDDTDTPVWIRRDCLYRGAQGTRLAAAWRRRNRPPLPVFKLRHRQKVSVAQAKKLTGISLGMAAMDFLRERAAEQRCET